MSFAPDGTDIAGQSNTLFEVLGARILEPQWQREILRAFQTWAEVANINISIVDDNGAPFGAPGQMQGDPRFGDIRIAARPMPRDVISLSVRPGAVIDETWAGDILINSSYTFDGTDTDLYAVMLHEAGHALGVAHSSDRDSVMFAHANATTMLSGPDIASIQAIYGSRSPDRFESADGNGTFALATKLEFRDNGTTPLAVFGDLTTALDTDMFSMRVPENYRGPATFRLRADGVSLLAPELTIYDSSGHVLGQAQSQQSFGGVLVIQVPQVLPKGQYYVKVEAARADEFAIGTYGLAASLDGSSTASTELIDAVLQGPYQLLEPNELSNMLRDPSRLVSGVGIATHDWDMEYEDDEFDTDSDEDAVHEPFKDNDEEQPPVMTAGDFVPGVVDQTLAEAVHSLFIAQPQLLHFSLSVGSDDATQDATIQGTVVDDQGNIVASLTARAGESAAGSTLFLTPGHYSVIVISIPPTSALVSPVTYTMHGGNISDPIGPVVADPTIRPVYVCPNNPSVFCYPGARPSPRPFFIAPSRSRS